jgi:hypothetical protein
MTADEWEGLCLLIEEGWPGEFSDATADAWRVLLDDYSADQVIKGLKTLIARPPKDEKGRRFRPSVAEVVAAIRHDPSQLTGPEIAAVLWNRGGVMHASAAYKPGGFGLGERDVADDQAKLNAAAVHGRLVYDFVSTVGLDRLRSMDPRDDLYGAANRQRLEAEWDRFTERADERDVKVMIAGPSRGTLGRVDPLSALGRGYGRVSDHDGRGPRVDREDASVSESTDLGQSVVSDVS